MKEEFKKQITDLLDKPENLLLKKPYCRGVFKDPLTRAKKSKIQYNQKIKVERSSLEVQPISTEELVCELDPSSHKVLFDENVPSIVVKTNNGGWKEIDFQKMALSFQQNIRDKKTLHLCGNPTDFTLIDRQPTQQDNDIFDEFKQMWVERNMDGFRTKMVSQQLSYGDAGLLFYMDRNDKIKARTISYENGYTIISHNDSNGDRLLESIYYTNDSQEEVIDSYDDERHYRHIRVQDKDKTNELEWQLVIDELHGFKEIPLVTKYGKVAWDKSQSIIETFENLYNIYVVIERRHGWGILYIKGNFDSSTQKLAGSIIMNAKDNGDTKADAKFLTPPNGEGYTECLKSLFEQIQITSQCTFILPKDISISGKISGIAVQLTQSLDLESANQNAIEWTNVLNKMIRLFFYGVQREKVLTKKDKVALTNNKKTNIRGSFKVWMPKADSDYNAMILQLKANGIISSQTATEKCTVSNPDEVWRLKKETEELYKQRLKEKEDGLNTQNKLNEGDNKPKPKKTPIDE